MKKLGDYFEGRQRESGERFVTLTDDRPEWLQEAVRDAHNGDAPNDWIYEECRAACEAIDCGDIRDEDSLHEYADGRVDVYTRELMQWNADMCLSDTYAASQDEAQELGAGESGNMVGWVQSIQYCAIRGIAGTMLRAYEQAREDEEDEDKSKPVRTALP